MQPTTSTLFLSEDIDAHHVFLRRLAHSLVSNEADAEDLVQEVWLEALAHPPERFRRVRGWLRVATIHAASRLGRRDRNRKRREERVARPEEVPSTLDVFERDAFGHDLARLVDRLRDPYREVVRLRYLEGLSIHEIGESLGRPAGTVRSQLKRGLDQIRDRLDQSYGSRSSWGVLALALAGQPGGTALGPATPLTSKATLGTYAACAAGIGALLVSVVLLTQGTSRANAALAAAPVDSEGLAQPSSPAVLLPDRFGHALHELPATGALSLRVLESGSERPVSELDVALEPISATYPNAASLPSLEWLRTEWLRTDPSGQASHTTLGVGTWRIRPLWGEAREFEIRPGETCSLVLEVGHAVRVAGRVLDAQGRAIADAEVFASVPGAPQLARPVARTDVRGRYEIRSSADGWISAEKTGWAPSSAYLARSLGPVASTRSVQQLSDRSLDLLLPGRSGLFSGRVVDPTGRAVVGARLLLAGLHREEAEGTPSGLRLPPRTRSTRTDGVGGFELEKERHPIQRMVVSAPGYAPLVHFGALSWDRSEEVEIVLSPSARLFGVVRERGQPVPGAEVRVARSEPLSHLRTTTDEQGHYEVEGFPLGELELAIVHPDGRLSQHRRVVLDAQASDESGAQRTFELDFELGMDATIAGELVDASGRLLADRVISLEPVERAGRPARMFWGLVGADLERTKTDARGRFAFPGQAPGRYVVRAHSSEETSEAPLAWNAKVFPGRPIQLVAEPSPRVLGEIRGQLERSTPFLEGTELRMGALELTRPVKAELDLTNGAFVARDLPAGDYRLWLHVPGRVPTELMELALEPGESQELGRVRAPDAVSLSLSIASAAGVLPDGVQVVLTGRSVVLNSAAETEAFTHQADGTLRLAPMPPGLYDLLVKAPGHVDHRAELELVSGTEPTLAITLRAGVPVELVFASERPLVKAAALVYSVLHADGSELLRKRVDPTQLPGRLYSDELFLPEGEEYRVEVVSDCGLFGRETLHVTRAVTDGALHVMLR